MACHGLRAGTADRTSAAAGAAAGRASAAAACQPGRPVAANWIRGCHLPITSSLGGRIGHPGPGRVGLYARGRSGERTRRCPARRSPPWLARGSGTKTRRPSAARPGSRTNAFAARPRVSYRANSAACWATRRRAVRPSAITSAPTTRLIAHPRRAATRGARRTFASRRPIVCPTSQTPVFASATSRTPVRRSNASWSMRPRSPRCCSSPRSTLPIRRPDDPRPRCAAMWRDRRRAIGRGRRVRPSARRAGRFRRER